MSDSSSSSSSSPPPSSEPEPNHKHALDELWASTGGHIAKRVAIARAPSPSSASVPLDAAGTAPKSVVFANHRHALRVEGTPDASEFARFQQWQAQNSAEAKFSASEAALSSLKDEHATLKDKHATLEDKHATLEYKHATIVNRRPSRPPTGQVGTEQGARPYSCPVEGCTYAARQRRYVTVHMRVHTGFKPHQCQVDGCEHKTAYQGHLTRHMLTHSGEKPYRCEEAGCTYAATQKAHLIVHLRKHETGKI